MDALLLKILKHREHYETLMPQIDNEILHPTTSYVLEAFGNWFRDTQDTVIDMEDFKSFFFNFLKPNDTADKKKYYNSLLNNCKPNADSFQIALIIQNLISHSFATQVGNIIARYNEGEEVDIINEIGIKHTLAIDQLGKDEEEVHRDLDEIEEILDKDLYQTGVKFSLAILRDNLRPLQSGDFIITAGRPDSGKTSFLSSQLLSFLNTIEGGRPVLWFNNEGEGNRIIKRIYQSVLQARTKDLLQYRNDGSLNKRFNLLVQNPERIKIIDCHGWNTGDIEKTVKRYQPGLIIVDMIDNILFPNIRDGSRTDQVLEGQYQWFRILGVRYGFPVIATSQVSAEAEQQTHTQMWPALSMLKDSKCLGKGTPIRMFTGVTLPVEQLRVGDYVMGLDSEPRLVLSTGSGIEEMYKVESKGWEFVCNKSHIFTVIKSTNKPMNGHKQGQILDIPLTYFLKNPSRLYHYKALQAKTEYPQQNVLIDPYLFGLWLGDGNSRAFTITTADKEIYDYLHTLQVRNVYEQPTKNLWDITLEPGRSILRELGVYKDKHIPNVYKYSSSHQRMQLLAGLIDSDGYLDHGNTVICMARKYLIEDINEVARSLGYRTSIKYKKTNFDTDSWRLTISNTDLLPVKLGRKQTVCKQQYSTMCITPLGIDTYYGFTVDKDARYVLGNQIVTHNTGKQGAADTVIMIGRSLNPDVPIDDRFISTPKNKLAIEQSYIKSEVTFNAQRATYE